MMTKKKQAGKKQVAKKKAGKKKATKKKTKTAKKKTKTTKKKTKTTKKKTKTTKKKTKTAKKKTKTTKKKTKAAKKKTKATKKKTKTAKKKTKTTKKKTKTTKKKTKTTKKKTNKTKRDPGQSAITGFRMQAVLAILDGLRFEDWTEFCVEPSDCGTGEDYEKVDIRWVLVGGARRHDQVKSSSRSFNKRDANKWAEALGKSSGAERKRLVLIGTPQTSMETGFQHCGVSVEVRPVGRDLFRNSVVTEIGELCEQNGHSIGFEQSARVAHLLSGLVLLDSSQGRPWTRGDFLGEVFRLAKEQSAYPRYKKLMADLLRSMFNRDGVVDFMRRLSSSSSISVGDVESLDEIAEAQEVYVKSVDVLTKRDLIQDSGFFEFLQQVYRTHVTDIADVRAAVEGSVGLNRLSGVSYDGFLIRSIPQIIHEQGFAGVRRYLTMNRGLLPVEYVGATRIFYVDGVRVGDDLVDIVSVRADSMGQNCNMYYFCDPEVPLWGGPEASDRLRDLLRRVDRHVKLISQPFDAKHPLYGRLREWDPYLVGLIAQFGCRYFHVTIIGGRRDLIPQGAEDIRPDIERDWQRNKGIALDIMTYNRLWQPMEQR